MTDEQLGFEGIEKVLEIIFSAEQRGRTVSDQVNASPVKDRKDRKGLLRIERNQWQSLLNQVKCRILDKIENEFTTAYLLSESSLFVYEDRIIIKTCGKTTLLLALQTMIEMAADIGLETIQSLFYSRKGYMFPGYQNYPHGHWDEEVEYIRSVLLSHGSYHIKNLAEKKDDWAIIIATPTSRISEIDIKNMTLEIQMSDIDPKVTAQFYNTQKDVYKRSGISRIYPMSNVNDYIFDPCGYSLNGLLQEYYYTIHVTPENHCSYISFESSIPIKEIDFTQKYTLMEIVNLNLEIFKPGNFTISLVSRKGIDPTLELKGHGLKDYIFSSSLEETLDSIEGDIWENGWNVYFYSFEREEQVDR